MYGKDTLGIERINMAREEDDYMPVFFMGVGSSGSEDEDDIRFRQELIHQQLIGEITDSNADRSPETCTVISFIIGFSTKSPGIRRHYISSMFKDYPICTYLPEV